MVGPITKSGSEKLEAKDVVISRSCPRSDYSLDHFLNKPQCPVLVGNIEREREHLREDLENFYTNAQIHPALHARDVLRVGRMNDFSGCKRPPVRRAG